MTTKTPPRLENITSFGDNQVGIHSLAKLHPNNSKNFALHSRRDDR